MSFDDLLKAGRIRPLSATRQDVHLLLSRARLQLADARIEATSLDGRFTAAYHAALNLATIPLLASGFRPSGAGHHVTIVAGLRAALGPNEGDFAKMLD